MEIPVHKKRFVLLAAFDAYTKVLAAAKKSSEAAHCSTSDIDEKSVILETLKAEYQNVDGQLSLEGTPLGEAMTDAHYKDDDGTPLGADQLDDWMRRTAGAYVPIAVIAEWVLEKRKRVAAWLRSIDTNAKEAEEKAKADPDFGGAELPDEILHTIRDDAQRVGRTCAPDFIDVLWFTPPTPVLPAPVPDAEVESWINRGPWSVGPYEPEEGSEPEPGAEWEIVKKDEAGTVVDRYVKVYPSQDEARQHAAQINRDAAVDCAVATAAAEPLHPADEPAVEPAVQISK
jgi:hypothetical protein